MGYARRDTSHKITTARARRQEQGRLAQEVCEGQGEREMTIATGGWEGNHEGNFFLLMWRPPPIHPSAMYKYQ